MSVNNVILLQKQQRHLREELDKKEQRPNPCYKCYDGINGGCDFNECRFRFEHWARNVKAKTIRV